MTLEVLVRGWMVSELSGRGVTYFRASGASATVTNDTNELILDGGVGERWGGTGIEVYAGTTAEYPRDVEIPFECTAERMGND